MKKKLPKELTITAAQRATGLSRQMVYNLCWSGAVTARKFGWQWFVDTKSLEEYCERVGREFTAPAAGTPHEYEYQSPIN